MPDKPKSPKEQLQVQLPAQTKHFKLIACEIYYRELCKLIAESEHIIDLQFLPKGLHDIKTEDMATQLQQTIDSVEANQYDAILLAYGRCNNGIVGVQARELPLVVPRVHDCIGALFGSASRYGEYFQNNPGTFYRSSGWTERDNSPADSVMSQLGLDFTSDQLIDKYGTEDAQYIMETLGCWTEQYQNITYIDMGLKIDQQYAQLAHLEALKKNLNFNVVKGNISLLENLLNGHWPTDDFLVVLPHHIIKPNDTGLVIESGKPPEPN